MYKSKIVIKFEKRVNSNTDLIPTKIEVTNINQDLNMDLVEDNEQLRSSREKNFIKLYYERRDHNQDY